MFERDSEGCDRLPAHVMAILFAMKPFALERKVECVIPFRELLLVIMLCEIISEEVFQVVVVVVVVLSFTTTA